MINNHNKIKTLFWNARSITNKKVEFLNLIRTQNIEIAILTETWLKEKAFSDALYDVIVCNREFAKGGGVAILIKKNIKYEIVSQLKTKVFETVSVKIKINSNEITFIAAYFPGGNSNKQKLLDFKQDLNLFNKLSGNYIIAGDFNAMHTTWNCMRNNIWGKVLDQKLCHSNFSLHFPSTPTYVPTNSKRSFSTLDLILTNISNFLDDPFTINELNSDHLPVVFNINQTASLTIPSPVFSFNKTKWNKFNNVLNKVLTTLNLSEINTNSDMDIFVSKLHNALHDTINKVVPQKILHKKDWLLCLSDHIKHLISLRNLERRRWQRSRSSIHKILYSYYNKTIKINISELKNKHWNTFLASLDKGSKPFWNLCRVMKKKKTKMPALNFNGTLISNNKEKAIKLAEYFVNQNSLTSNFSDITTKNIVQHSIYSLSPLPSGQIPNISLSDIISVSKNLKIRKAPGIDHIPNIVLKNLSKSNYKFLCAIFNKCLELGYFPEKWKIALVTCIPKPGKDKSKVESYRPISLLNTIGKLFEKLIKSRIEKYLEDSNILPNEQFGFRNSHSTVHQVNRIKNLIKKQFTLKNSVGMLTLDIEKAFDSVWHDALIHKLMAYGFPIYIIKIIQSFLKDRCFVVKIGTDQSNNYNITAGVPQGSSLSPILYNLFIADIPKPENCDMALYADDTALISSSPNPTTILTNLEYGFLNIQDYYYKWKIKINGEKTKAIFFTKKRIARNLPNRNLMLNNCEISWENEFIKYLGIYLDKKLLFKTHFEKTIDKINLYIKIMYPIINKKADLNRNNKLLLFKTIFRSILLYGFPVWKNVAKTNLELLQKKQNSILKLLLLKPRCFSTTKLHDLANLNTVQGQIDKLVDAYENSCYNNHNPLIRAIVDQV